MILLLLSETAVTLPLTTHTTSFIADYYERNRWPIAIAQLGQLGATAALWMFIRALGASMTRATDTRDLRRSGFVVCVASVLPSVPVLALALLAGIGPSTTRTLAGWTDRTDDILFATIAVFGVVCARSTLPLWARICAWILALLAAARTMLGILGNTSLTAVAPIVFLGFMLALSVRMLTTSRRLALE